MAFPVWNLYQIHIGGGHPDVESVRSGDGFLLYACYGFHE